MTHRFLAFAVTVVLAGALAGCRSRVRVVEQTTVTSGGAQPVVTSGGARPVSVSHRHYRNLLRIAAREMRCRHDELVTQEISAGMFSVRGCGMAREYVMVCRHRYHCRWHGVVPVEQVALAETRCASGPMQLSVSGPITRQVSLCGQSLHYALVCGAHGCAWTRGVAATGVVLQTEPGTSVLVVPDDGSAAPPPAPAAAAPATEDADAVPVEQMGVAASLQGVFATQIAAIRQCTAGQTVTVRVRWDASGTVSIALAPPHAGTPIEQCIRTAIGPLMLQGVGAAGEVQASL